jgi:hypothetical protein
VRSATDTPPFTCAPHRLFDELAIARADGRLVRLVASWARVGVLVIDDLLIRPLTPDQAADLLEVIEDGAQRRSTIITSQLPVALWHEALGDATIADAVLPGCSKRSIALSCMVSLSPDRPASQHQRKRSPLQRAGKHPQNRRAESVRGRRPNIAKEVRIRE